MHSGAPTPPIQGHLRRYLAADEEAHKLIIEERTNKEIANDWMSPAFSTDASWAMTFSPRFIVEREGCKPRLVNNQTMSGLNKGILRADCPTIYDLIVDLIRLLCYLKETSPKVLNKGVLYKMDVGSAFRLLPMHPL